MTEKRLKEKIALVTGASSGIGRAIAGVLPEKGLLRGLITFAMGKALKRHFHPLYRWALREFYFGRIYQIRKQLKK